MAVVPRVASQASRAGDWNNGLYFAGSLRESYQQHEQPQTSTTYLPSVRTSVPAKLPAIAERSHVLEPSPRLRRKRRGAKDKDDVIPDIFAEHWLVESPRRIQFEKTTLTAPSKIGAQLEDFYNDVAQIPDKYIKSSKVRTKTLTDYVMPRITKLGNQIGMKIKGWKYGGSTVDDTQVVLPKEIDIFVMIEKFKAKTSAIESGYRMVPLRRYRPKPGSPPDEFRFARSMDGSYLSSLTVAKNLYDLIERALKLNPQVELQPFEIEQDRPQIVVTFKNKHRFHFIPTLQLETDNLYLTTRPYAYDFDPESDMLWRVNYMEKERQMLELMDRADRGVRRKAFKCLKALVKVEHTLHALSSYHIKTVLLQSFSDSVDHSPRWQKDTLETAFIALLRELHHHLQTRNLEHFYIDGFNLFACVPSRKLAALEGRIGYLLGHPAELLRILKKRSK